MAAEDAVFLGHAHHAVHAREALDLGFVERGGVADEVDFGQGLLGADLLVHAGLDVRLVGEVVEHLAVLGAVVADVGFEDDDHSLFQK